MKQFIQENKRMLILTALAILTGILIGFSIGISLPNLQAEETGANKGAFLAPNAELIAELTFSCCEHTERLAIDPEKFVGYDKDAFQNSFPDAVIKKFRSNQVVFSKYITGVCSKHYLMQMKDESKIVVRKFDKNILDMCDAITIGLPASMLEPALLDELQEGVIFSTMDEVNAYLENAES